MMASNDSSSSNDDKGGDAIKQDEPIDAVDKIDDDKEDSAEPPVLSKNAQKRLLKRKTWLDQRPERRAKEREKRKRKMEAMKDVKQFDETRSASRKALKHLKMTDSPCKVGVVFDMDFDELMSQKDLGKTLKQVLHCYAVNRRLPAPLQLYITSFEGRLVAEMEKHQGHQNWDLHFQPKKYNEVLEKDNIVYLSSESENVLEKLENDKFYVIGGLVDHNLHKGICHQRATEAGIKTARLPIDEFVEMKTRKVLTIDHVFQILARVTEGKSWKEAFLTIIPERKGAVDKQHKNTNSQVKDEEVLPENCHDKGEKVLSENGHAKKEVLAEKVHVKDEEVLSKNGHVKDEKVLTENSHDKVKEEVLAENSDAKDEERRDIV